MAAIARLVSRAAVDGLYYGLMTRFPSAAPALSRSVAAGLSAFAPAMVRTLEENARLALGPDASDESVRRCARTVLLRMQESIRGTLLSGDRTVAELADAVRSFSGQDGYHRVRDSGRGLLVASIHMGAFEPCLALLRRYEERINVLFHADPMPRFEAARSALRSSIGVVEHRMNDGLDAWVSLRDALGRGEVVVMHADRSLGGLGGSRMPFLGAEDAVLPTGPVRLALACGAAIVPTFCFESRHGLCVRMDEPIDFPQQVLRGSEVAEHPAQRMLVRSMERAIRDNPDQWLAFWRVRGGGR